MARAAINELERLVDTFTIDVPSQRHSCLRSPSSDVPGGTEPRKESAGSGVVGEGGLKSPNVKVDDGDTPYRQGQTEPTKKNQDLGEGPETDCVDLRRLTGVWTGIKEEGTTRKNDGCVKTFITGNPQKCISVDLRHLGRITASTETTGLPSLAPFRIKYHQHTLKPTREVGQCLTRTLGPTR